MDLVPGGKMPVTKSGDVNWDLLWGLTHFICRMLNGYFENIQRDLNVELAHQPSQGVLPEAEAEHWEGPSVLPWRHILCDPQIGVIFLHSYVKGWRDILVLLASWFACKGGIHRLVSQDQMSSRGSNRLALSILWSLWVCQCDLGSGLQHLGLCYRYSLLWETSQIGLKANLAMTSLLTWSSLVAKLIKNPLAMQEIWVWTVGW